MSSFFFMKKIIFFKINLYICSDNNKNPLPIEDTFYII